MIALLFRKYKLGPIAMVVKHCSLLNANEEFLVIAFASRGVAENLFQTSLDHGLYIRVRDLRVDESQHEQGSP